MTPTQFRAAIERSGMTQREFGYHFGIGTRTVRDALKRGVVNEPLALLLRLYMQGKVTLGDVYAAKV